MALAILLRVFPLRLLLEATDFRCQHPIFPQNHIYSSHHREEGRRSEAKDSLHFLLRPLQIPPDFFGGFGSVGEIRPRAFETALG